MGELTALEICAGAGGQALGLEAAGFEHELAVEIDAHACQTLRHNRPQWHVHEGDVREINGREHRGLDLLGGGVPCPPFSIAGKQLGADDERDLFPEALRLVREMNPRAVMLENVKGLASARFEPYRTSILQELDGLGYESFWQLLNASDFGVPQLRPRFILVALKRRYANKFKWPEPFGNPPSVGETLLPFMAANGWAGAENWAQKAQGIGPTLVGGSKKHGGADLGPTRAKAAWRALGVDGMGLANTGPDEETDFDHIPKLTVQMAAAVQGFPRDYEIMGRKTAAYRQVGNAFPPPVAAAVGASIATALGAKSVVEEVIEARLDLAHA